jgi:hypothetical protein
MYTWTNRLRYNVWINGRCVIPGETITSAEPFPPLPGAKAPTAQEPPAPEPPAQEPPAAQEPAPNRRRKRP